MFFVTGTVNGLFCKYFRFQAVRPNNFEVSAFMSLFKVSLM